MALVLTLSNCGPAASQVEEPPASSAASAADEWTTGEGKKKLDRRTRSELIFIVLVLALLGIGMIVFTWLGARVTRRYMRSSQPPRRRPLDSAFTDDWASKPLSDAERARMENEDW